MLSVFSCSLSTNNIQYWPEVYLKYFMNKKISRSGALFQWQLYCQFIRIISLESYFFIIFFINIVKLVLFLCLEISTWGNIYNFTKVFEHLCTMKDYALDEHILVHQNAVLNVYCEPSVLQPAFGCTYARPVWYEEEVSIMPQNYTWRNSIRHHLISP